MKKSPENLRYQQNAQRLKENKNDWKDNPSKDREIKQEEWWDVPQLQTQKYLSKFYI